MSSSYKGNNNYPNPVENPINLPDLGKYYAARLFKVERCSGKTGTYLKMWVSLEDTSVDCPYEQNDGYWPILLPDFRNVDQVYETLVAKRKEVVAVGRAKKKAGEDYTAETTEAENLKGLIIAAKKSVDSLDKWKNFFRNLVAKTYKLVEYPSFEQALAVFNKQRKMWVVFAEKDKGNGKKLLACDLAFPPEVALSKRDDLADNL
jgi:hypothetical protein